MLKMAERQVELQTGSVNDTQVVLEAIPDDMLKENVLEININKYGDEPTGNETACTSFESGGTPQDGILEEFFAGDSKSEYIEESMASIIKNRDIDFERENTLDFIINETIDHKQSKLKRKNVVARALKKRSIK